MASMSASTNSGSSAGDGTVGVQDLIDKLKSEGVAEGRQQADALLAEAKREAAAIIDRARAEADDMLRDAQRESDRMQTNGRRALTLASRDTSLQLKEQLQHRFRGWIGGLVHKKLEDPNFLGELIIGVGKAAVTSGAAGGGESADSAETGGLEVLVPEASEAKVRAFVEGQAAELFREGVQLSADRSGKQGFRVQLADGHSQLELTPEAVTSALMRFLAPKFRQVIESASAEDSNQNG